MHPTHTPFYPNKLLGHDSIQVLLLRKSEPLHLVQVVAVLTQARHPPSQGAHIYPLLNNPSEHS